MRFLVKQLVVGGCRLEGPTLHKDWRKLWSGSTTPIFTLLHPNYKRGNIFILYFSIHCLSFSIQLQQNPASSVWSYPFAKYFFLFGKGPYLVFIFIDSWKSWGSPVCNLSLLKCCLTVFGGNSKIKGRYLIWGLL